MARPMRAEDLPEVLKIEHASYSTPWPESSFRGLIGRPDTDLFVADGGGEVAGYAVSWAVIDQGELGNIAVAPAWRRRGVGKLLLERVIEAMQARGVKELFLEVRVSNQVAQRLYRAHGFHEVGVRRDYYSIPVEDALVMRLALDS
jgi:ribosomal-protein-alanine N-acetyltransferase